MVPLIKMQNNTTRLYFIIFILSFLFFKEIKSQTSFALQLKMYLDKHKLTPVKMDSLNNAIDTNMLSHRTSENLLIQLLRIDQIAKDINYSAGQADAEYNIAFNYVFTFKTEKALNFFLKSLTISTELKDTARMARVNMQIGIVNLQQKNYASALKYFNASAKLYQHTMEEKKRSLCYYLLGIVHMEFKTFDSAKYYFTKAISLKFKLPKKDEVGLAQSYMEMANMFIQQQMPDSALAMVNNSIIHAGSFEHDHAFLSKKYNMEGQAYLLQKKNELAEQAATKCYREAKLNGRPALISDAYQLSYKVAFAIKNYHMAFDFLNKFLIMKDSLFSAEKAEALTRIESQSEIEKIQTQKKLLEEQNQLRSKLNYSFVAGLLLLLLISLLLYNRNRIKQRTNNIITQQKNMVDKKNLEITQSITYAKRIQNAILPPQKLIRHYLQNSFILYKPKDIVAGDFYWMETVQISDTKFQIANLKSEIILFAACDCTGHGVPGALVSVVCHNALNRAVREFGLTQPAAILDKTAQLVIENFSKSEEEIKDGMDISLCAFNTSTNQLQWAGANNALWIVKAPGIHPPMLHETIADKQPIGEDIFNQPFTNHTFLLNPGDTIYLFTDGYADQFGGPTGQKKLTRKRFKELILSLHHFSMEQQKTELDKFITHYQNKEEQIDDILVMGIRV